MSPTAQAGIHYREAVDTVSLMKEALRDARPFSCRQSRCLFAITSSFTSAAVAVLSAFTADLSHVFAILAHGFAAFTANFRHVLPVLAYFFSTLAPGFACLFRVELVGRSAFMRDLSALAADLGHMFPAAAYFFSASGLLLV